MASDRRVLYMRVRWGSLSTSCTIFSSRPLPVLPSSLTLLPHAPTASSTCQITRLPPNHTKLTPHHTIIAGLSCCACRLTVSKILNRLNTIFPPYSSILSSVSPISPRCLKQILCAPLLRITCSGNNIPSVALIKSALVTPIPVPVSPSAESRPISDNSRAYPLDRPAVHQGQPASHCRGVEM